MSQISNTNVAGRKAKARTVRRELNWFVVLVRVAESPSFQPLYVDSARNIRSLGSWGRLTLIFPHGRAD